MLTMNKFDVVFSNPPYNHGKYITLLNDLIEKNVADRIIAVHPSTSIYCKESLYKKDKMRQQIKSVDIFWGNKMFDIGLFLPVCITVYDKNNTSDKIHVKDTVFAKEEYDEEYNNITYFGTRNKEFLAFADSIKEYMKTHDGNILNHNINSKYEGMTDFSVRFAGVRGNTGQGKDGCQEDFWSLITKKGGSENECKSDFRFSADINHNYGNNLTLWSFPNDTIQHNFITYCKTKVVRFLLTFTKFNANLMSGHPTDIIPWMDFTKVWTDEELVKEFNISQELWNYIDKFIPDYYEDYRTAVRGEL